MQMLQFACNRDMKIDPAVKEYEKNVLKSASERDLALVKMINEKWADSGWIKPGIDPTPYVAFSAEGEPFYANGRIVATDMPVFLSLQGFMEGEALFQNGERVSWAKHWR